MQRNLILVIILLGLLSLVIIRNNQLNQGNILGISTRDQATPTITESPEPTAFIIQGRVVSISSNTVEYKDSLVAVVQTNSASENVYLTPATNVYTGDNLQITREDIDVGDNIYIQGISVEGGVEAMQVIVLSSATVSPNPTTSMTLTPTTQSTPTISP